MNPPPGSRGRCVIIPSYNSGPLLENTVHGVLARWQHVIVVLDGSTDRSEEPLIRLAKESGSLQILRLPQNQGKGAATLAGLAHALAHGYTHAVVFDSDGQHDPSDIPTFIEASLQHPEAMILGEPVFGADAPWERVLGRRIGNWWTNLETLWGGIADSLFGFRLYPIQPSVDVLESIQGGRRFDFDTQLAVRLYWAGVPPLNLRTRVRYRTTETGGVTHFNYWRDNLLLSGAHMQLTTEALQMLPRLLRLRRRLPLELQ